MYEGDNGPLGWKESLGSRLRPLGLAPPTALEPKAFDRDVFLLAVPVVTGLSLTLVCCTFTDAFTEVEKIWLQSALLRDSRKEDLAPFVRHLSCPPVLGVDSQQLSPSKHLDRS